MISTLAPPSPQISFVSDVVRARCTFPPAGEHPKMKEDIEAQGKLKRARLDSAKNNSQLMDTNIQELGNAELRDSQVQTKVMVCCDK